MGTLGIKCCVKIEKDNIAETKVNISFHFTIRDSLHIISKSMRYQIAMKIVDVSPFKV